MLVHRHCHQEHRAHREKRSSAYRPSPQSQQSTVSVCCFRSDCALGVFLCSRPMRATLAIRAKASTSLAILVCLSLSEGVCVCFLLSLNVLCRLLAQIFEWPRAAVAGRGSEAADVRRAAWQIETHRRNELGCTLFGFVCFLFLLFRFRCSLFVRFRCF